MNTLERTRKIPPSQSELESRLHGLVVAGVETLQISRNKDFPIEIRALAAEANRALVALNRAAQEHVQRSGSVE